MPCRFRRPPAGLSLRDRGGDLQTVAAGDALGDRPASCSRGEPSTSKRPTASCSRRREPPWWNAKGGKGRASLRVVSRRRPRGSKAKCLCPMRHRMADTRPLYAGLSPECDPDPDRRVLSQRPTICARAVARRFSSTLRWRPAWISICGSRRRTALRCSARRLFLVDGDGILWRSFSMRPADRSRSAPRWCSTESVSPPGSRGTTPAARRPAKRTNHVRGQCRQRLVRPPGAVWEFAVPAGRLSRATLTQEPRVEVAGATFKMEKCRSSCSDTPGATCWAGRDAGSYNLEVISGRKRRRSVPA